MEARLVEALPTDPGRQFEPKWDGFRCLAFGAQDRVELKAKSGKSLTRYFPEIVAMLRNGAEPFVADGELAIPVGDTLSFDALQMRLHPAESRIRKLAAETPAIFILFDCLATAAQGRLLDRPLHARRAALEHLFRKLRGAHRLRLTPFTRSLDEATSWLENAHGALDGIVAKRLEEFYTPGERAMLKVKLQRSADCVVGGFRYAQGRREVGSLLLGLYNDDGQLDHVGFTSAIAMEDRAALTRRLEALRGPPGFTGNAPGGPSRWSNDRSSDWEPVRPELVVEVRYDQVTGHRFRHGTKIRRWRPDKAPRQCTIEQLGREARPSKLIKEMMAGWP